MPEILLLVLVLFLFAAPTGEADGLQSFRLDYDTPVDVDLQERLETIDADLRKRFDMTTQQTAIGAMDLRDGRIAMIHPDRIEYAASVPKVGILLAWFELHPEAATELDNKTRRELGEMIKSSSNEMATRFSEEIGLEQVQTVINRYGLYDETRGGGIWVGKHYGRAEPRIGDPLADHSHGATIRQLMRFYLMLEQGRLVSSEASKTMREIFESPDIPHDDIKFVKGLEGREVKIIRKWGSWEDWLHDTAVVKADNRHYIVVGLTRHPKGDEYLEALAQEVDVVMKR